MILSTEREYPSQPMAQSSMESSQPRISFSIAMQTQTRIILLTMRHTDGWVGGVPWVSRPFTKHYGRIRRSRRHSATNTTSLIAGSPKQKGVITYSLSANRQNPFAGALHAAIFNTWRRSKNQIGYWLPPFAIAYLALDWATKRSVWS